MVTLIIYDGNEYYQATVSVNVQDTDGIRKLLPRAHDLVFSIEDDVVVLDEDCEPLESRSL